MIQTIVHPVRSRSLALIALLATTVILGFTLVGRAEATAPIDYRVTVYSDASYGFNQPGTSVVYDGHFFVANVGSGTITQMSTATGAFEKSISGVLQPSFMTAYDGKLWVSSYDTNKIYVVDIATGTVTQTLTDGTFSCPSGIVPAGGKIWVAQNCAARVTVLNTDGTIAATLSGAPYNFSWPFIITSDGTNVWVPNTGTNAVTKLNLTPTAGSYFAASYDNTNTPGASFSGLRQTLSDGVSIWVLSNNTKVITQIDIATGDLIRVLSGPAYQFGGFGLAVVYGDYLWFPNNSGNLTTVVNKSDGTVAAILTGSPYNFSNPSSSATGDDAVWIPNYNNNTVTELHNLLPPTAPLNTNATLSGTTATITWDPPASDGGSAITGYTVTAAPGGATCTATAPATTCDIAGLDNATTYTFTVVATNTNGNSPGSAASNEVTTAGVPTAPQNVTATVSGGTATVTWTAPSSDGGSAITNYVVSGAPGNANCTVIAPTHTCQITDLAEGTTYTFSVVANNAAGSSDPASAPAVLVPVVPVVPNTPVTPQFTG